jgi:DeoR/GlpR family transcriptional regulator of sugar metabolism
VVVVLGPQRRSAIVNEVRRRGGVRLSELASALGVSDMTVRRDVEALVEQGLLTRVHGGVLPVDTPADEPAFATKQVRQAAEKAAIATAAAALVTPGSAVGISAGTTTAALAQKLTEINNLTVVTNSVAVSDVLHRAANPTQTVILTGGVRTPSDALVGPAATTLLAGLNLDVLFLGVHGMDERGGFTTPNLAEAETNRALVAAARRTVVVADHTKWGVVGIATIIPLNGADVLVTDAGIDPAALGVLRANISEVMCVDVPAPPAAGRSSASRSAATRSSASRSAAVRSIPSGRSAPVSRVET